MYNEHCKKPFVIRFNREIEFYQDQLLPYFEPHLTTGRMVRFDLGTVVLRYNLPSDTKCMTNIIKTIFMRFSWEFEYYQVHPLSAFKPHLTTVRMVRFDLGTVKLR